MSLQSSFSSYWNVGITSHSCAVLISITIVNMGGIIVVTPPYFYTPIFTFIYDRCGRRETLLFSAGFGHFVGYGKQVHLSPTTFLSNMMLMLMKNHCSCLWFILTINRTVQNLHPGDPAFRLEFYIYILFTHESQFTRDGKKTAYATNVNGQK